MTIPGFHKERSTPRSWPVCLPSFMPTFGVRTAKSKNGNGGSAPSGGVSKSDLEKLINAAPQTAPAQTIRIEQAPLQIGGNPPAPQGPPKADDTYKM